MSKAQLIQSQTAGERCRFLDPKPKKEATFGYDEESYSVL